VVQVTTTSDVTAAVTVMAPNLVRVTPLTAALITSPLSVATVASLSILSAGANGSGWTNILIGYSDGAAVVLLEALVAVYNILVVVLAVLLVVLVVFSPAGLPRDADGLPKNPP
jgi:hypothetical protein